MNLNIALSVANIVHGFSLAATLSNFSKKQTIFFSSGGSVIQKKSKTNIKKADMYLQCNGIDVE